MSPWRKFEKKSVFLFSGDNEFFITYISYLGLATGQFMEIHHILSLFYGGYNIPYAKNSTFTEYEKVQVGKDQEKAQSAKIPTPKTEVGKNQTNNQVLIP